MVNDNSMLYMAYDGDNAGRLVGRAILADNPDALHEISARINLGHEIVKRWVEGQGGQFISGGGDEGTFSIPAQALNEIEQLREDYRFATNLTMTVGAGSTLSEAGKSLLVGKFKGKNTVVQYDPSVEDEIRRVQESMGQGTASPEEQKLGEAYLKPEGEETVEKKSELDDCPYCKDMGEEHSCPYCQEYDAKQGGAELTDDCPYCRDMDDDHDCQYCREYDAKQGEAAPADGVEQTAGPSVVEPTAQTSEEYESKGLNEPAIPKPQPGDEPPIPQASAAISGTDNQKDTTANQALGVVDGQPVEDATPAVSPQEEIGETPRAILQQLDAEDPQATPDDIAAVANIDDADLAIGNNAEENTSRPEDYDRNNPQDMGLGEEEQQDGPDLSGVLQEGLDNHAESAQREKVVQMVSEALEGFKGCKQILEKAKEQAPQLYQSSLAMLRAMIEMAKMLGLNETTEETAEEVVGGPGEGEAEMGDPNAQAPEEGQDHDWEQPFKQHPEHGAAAPEDAAGDPKLKRQ